MEIKSYEKGDLTEAERLYRRAIALVEELSDVVGMSIWMVNLAMLCEDQGRLNEALPLLKWAMEILARRFAACGDGTSVLEAGAPSNATRLHRLGGAQCGYH